MSFGSIFRFKQQASTIAPAEPPAGFHPALDPDASARLAAMDRDFCDDAPAGRECTPAANESVTNESETATNSTPEIAAIEAPAEMNAGESVTVVNTNQAADEIDTNDPLAILMQTMEPAAPESAAAEVAATEEVVAPEQMLESAPEPVIDRAPESESEPAVVAGSLETAEVSSATETGSVADEIDLAPVVAIQRPLSEVIPDVEVNGIFRAAAAATEIILHPPATEAVVEDIPALETEIETVEAPAATGELNIAPESLNANNSEFSAHAQADANADAEAPAPLEVAPILNASGELDPSADAYVPPAPFEIHVPASLTLEATPADDSLSAESSAPEQSAEELEKDLLAAQEFEVAQALAAAPQRNNLEKVSANQNAGKNETAAENNAGHAAQNSAPPSFDDVETFDLETLCAPTEEEQLAAQEMGQAIDHAIQQEEAVAEMSAAAEEFVAEQIACEEQTGHPCPPPEETPSTQHEDTPKAIAGSPLESAAAALRAEPASDRRRKRRALISAPIRVRSVDLTTSGPDEIATTVDVSRYGILFYTVLDTYQRGMDVAVVFPYHKAATGSHAEQFGRVVRLHDMPDGRHAVAIALGVGIGEHLVDASGRQLADNKVHLSNSPAPPVKRPLVLIADSDDMLRDTTKIFLQNEGYEVIAVNNANDAREVLNMFTPAMIVAEIEGAGESDVLPGLDLCAHVKSSPSLKHIPVVMTSRSAYPSDYSNAHSLGAVVCMAKPYKQERLGHVVRLLAPLPEHLQPVCTQRPPDPTRGFTRDSNVALRNGNGKPRNGNGKKPATNGAASRREPAQEKFQVPQLPLRGPPLF